MSIKKYTLEAHLGEALEAFICGLFDCYAFYLPEIFVTAF